MIEDGLILNGDRIIIPEALRSQILDALHTGHQGETKCILLARELVFWPSITNDIKQLVKDCDTYNTSGSRIWSRGAPEMFSEILLM